MRNLFAAARKRSPCIVFIDELDAVGRTRGTGLGGGHDEREQTLNQILAELDAFEGHEAIIVLARIATTTPGFSGADLKNLVRLPFSPRGRRSGWLRSATSTRLGIRSSSKRPGPW